MRLKKGFTLAEILIVLMVIGAIATMTIPSLIRGVQDAQFKTAFKKAYNTVLNVTAMERVNGALPTTATTTDVANFFGTLSSYLSVKEFAQPTAAASETGTISYTNGVSFTQNGISKTVGDTTDAYSYTASDISPWVITDDNMAYAVLRGGGTTTSEDDGSEVDNTSCSTKAAINAASTASDAFNKSCVVVVVDVNGLSKAPNAMNEQAEDGLSASDALAELSGDRFYIYVGVDGATVGSKDVTVGGRIIADMN